MAGVGGLPVDRYVVLEHLSEGGMGAIYVGKKLGAGGFEMAVVLKQLLPEFTQQEEFIDLFLREAKLSATLDHANIIHTIDLVTAGGEYFIVMEYLPGGDLRTLVKRARRRGQRFSPSAAIYVAREVLSALSYAHSKRDFDGRPLRLIHRDVSPSNVLVSYAGEVKLTDFGIAKAATHNSLFYKVKGKIGYMSPEQARSESLDSRSDLYSLAVCLYEVLTGERLFVHAGITTSAEEIYSQPIPTLSRKVPGVPTDLDAIMKKALAIDPATRYQTAGELNEALTRCAHKHGLLMSAPELAEELSRIVGPREQWRDDDDEDIAEPDGKRAGTEVYDVDDDDDEHGDGHGSNADANDADDDDDAPGPRSIHSIAAGVPGYPGQAGGNAHLRPKTEIAKLQGMELTSIINMMDIEGASPRDHEEAPMHLSGAFAAPMRAGPREAIVSRDVPSRMVLEPPPRRYPGAAPPVASPLAGGPPAPVAHRPSAPAPVMRPSAADRDLGGPPPVTAHPRTRTPASTPVGTPAPTPARRASALRPWMVIVAILVLAGIAAVVIAMSGPDVAAQRGK